MRAATAFVFASLLLGCATTERKERGSKPEVDVDACTAAHPASEPFDLGDSVAPLMESPSGSGELTRTVDIIAGVCQMDGASECEVDRFISRLAAECIASQAEPRRGPYGWGSTLLYEYEYRRVTWGVQTLLYTDAEGELHSRELTIDAVSGEVLDSRATVASP